VHTAQTLTSTLARSPTVQPPFRERRRRSGQEALPQLQRHL